MSGRYNAAQAPHLLACEGVDETLASTVELAGIQVPAVNFTIDPPHLLIYRHGAPRGQAGRHAVWALILVPTAVNGGGARPAGGRQVFIPCGQDARVPVRRLVAGSEGGSFERIFGDAQVVEEGGLTGGQPRPLRGRDRGGGKQADDYDDDHDFAQREAPLS